MPVGFGGTEKKFQNSGLCCVQYSQLPIFQGCPWRVLQNYTGKSFIVCSFITSTQQKKIKVIFPRNQRRVKIPKLNNNAATHFFVYLFQATQVIEETLSPTWDQLLVFDEILVYGRRCQNFCSWLKK